jgi:uncharacterized glyoxalase superfamily protein PhnB
MARTTAIAPVLRYRNADAAARWLCDAFGFQEHDRAEELGGRVRYVSLRLGDSIVLVRPVTSSILDDLMTQPDAVGGANTQICYLSVPDATAHHARAKGAGAKVELHPEDDGLGGLFYICRDPEGHLWSFGTRTYGVADDMASAFEPAEISPSRSSSPIVPPPPPTARGRGRFLREVAIVAATAVLVSGGWAYYGTYLGEALKEAAAASAATAARLDNTAGQLAQERNRRLAAEHKHDAAVATLAEERAVAVQLRQSAQRASAELADIRKEKDGAVRALESASAETRQLGLARDRAEAQVAAARTQIAEIETRLAQLASEATASSGSKEELQAAKAALLEANSTIEELRAGWLVPMVPDGGEPVAESSPCVQALQGKVASRPRAPATWTVANLSRLCRGAESSVEPAKCFEEIMSGKVEWGAGTAWATANAVALCSGTRSARRTLDCFKGEISSSRTWQAAIQQCRPR